jgi:hypothetical protein
MDLSVHFRSAVQELMVKVCMSDLLKIRRLVRGDVLRACIPSLLYECR